MTYIDVTSLSPHVFREGCCIYCNQSKAATFNDDDDPFHCVARATFEARR